MRCRICEFGCEVPEGGSGRCGTYVCEDGRIVERFPRRYLHVYPVSIETVPMLHYTPNGKYLLVSTAGCNFACAGCVSGVQARDPDLVTGAMTAHPPDAIVDLAVAEECIGVVFCLNEPTVSCFTFLELATAARERGLRVGCSTNGYMTVAALEALAPHLDFVNVGLKGCSDARYRECGAPAAFPVYRNIRILFGLGVHVEVSAMHLNGREEEVVGAARAVSAVSPSIPFQVMRFRPFGGEPGAEFSEPTVTGSEAVCDRVREMLDYVYLFNSPGTRYLDALCPHCGGVIARREFYGPMGARNRSVAAGGVCGTCGHLFPFVGPVGEEQFLSPRYTGGYRVPRAVILIRDLIASFGDGEGESFEGLWGDLVATGYLDTLHVSLGTVDGYLEMIADLAGQIGREEAGDAVVRSLEARVGRVRAAVAGSVERPRVYLALGHPLVPLYVDKMENDLVETAGGVSLNREMDWNEATDTELTAGEIAAFNPAAVVIAGPRSMTVPEFCAFFRDQGLDFDALRTGRVLRLDSDRRSAATDWAIALMEIANLLYPDVCAFDVEAERASLRKEIPVSRGDPACR
ncbi:MAG: hypothetical protein PWP08_636 [Methanofollis sp.]|nr:hypothetical protein [Methanofollis sp.]